jgi:thiamine-monophosphate kinase
MAENEDSLLRWLRRLLAAEGAGEELLGDDAAKIAVREDLAITMDSQIEGVHFFPGLPPEMLAERTLAVNLSDLAAMGARPRYAFLSLTAPPSFDRRAFFRAFVRSCRKAGLLLAGGDLSRAFHVQTVLTLLGERQGRFLERSGALPGDRIYLGGEIGLAALGLRLLEAGARVAGRRIFLPEALEKRFHRAARRALSRHLLPSPQLALGEFLAREKKRGAALDVSDGLAKDLHRLCRESGVGATIEAEALPFPSDSRRLAERLGENWLELALGGGEDYVLLFTLPEGEKPPREAVEIGRITSGRRISLAENGRSRPLPPYGFDHLAK